jgi:transglutaminase-like putative cysteine protease
MHLFDGRTWRGSYPVSLRGAALQPLGPAYRYTVSLEPHHRRWIFALDWPSNWDLPRGALTGDYTLVQPDPVSIPIDVAVTSHTQVQAMQPLSRQQRSNDTQLPPERNPRTRALSMQLRAEHADDLDYVRAVLEMFTRQPFYYTLSPPELGRDSVDEFLFDTRRGFCGHYASAFAALMRAAGIPARVVTGYQGGTFNRFADYWILRQSDAHAWDEVWIEGRGWMRVDPTAAIAPERVEHGLNTAVSAADSVIGRWQQRTTWLGDVRLRLDALRQLWRERILRFDQGSQERLLSLLRIPDPDAQKLVIVLAVALTLALSWLTWQVRRELDRAPEDPLLRAYDRLCAKLAAAGLPRRAHEGAEAYAVRVAERRPDLAAIVTALCRHYSALRYAAHASNVTPARFAAAVRAFKPRDSRGS